jgi:hypothetical protein
MFAFKFLYETGKGVLVRKTEDECYLFAPGKIIGHLGECDEQPFSSMIRMCHGISRLCSKDPLSFKFHSDREYTVICGNCIVLSKGQKTDVRRTETLRVELSSEEINIG